MLFPRKIQFDIRVIACHPLGLAVVKEVGCKTSAFGRKRRLLPIPEPDLFSRTFLIDIDIQFPGLDRADVRLSVFQYDTSTAGPDNLLREYVYRKNAFTRLAATGRHRKERFPRRTAQAFRFPVAVGSNQDGAVAAFGVKSNPTIFSVNRQDRIVLEEFTGDQQPSKGQQAKKHSAHSVHSVMCIHIYRCPSPANVASYFGSVTQMGLKWWKGEV